MLEINLLNEIYEYDVRSLSQAFFTGHPIKVNYITEDDDLCSIDEKKENDYIIYVITQKEKI